MHPLSESPYRVEALPEEENLRYFVKCLQQVRQEEPEVQQLLTDGGFIGKSKRHLFYHYFPELNLGCFTPPLVRPLLVLAPKISLTIVE